MMSKERFIRDGVLDDMIKQLKDILEEIPSDDPDFEYFFHYINSLLISYKTSKISLERIEESIEYARKIDLTQEIIIPLADAAMHIQTGIRSLHVTMLENTEKLMSEDEESVEEVNDLGEPFVSNP